MFFKLSAILWCLTAIARSDKWQCLQLMEDALVAMQQSLESANQQRDAAVDKMSQDERIEVRQMLNSLHVRLVNLQEHLDERKRYTYIISLSFGSHFH